MDEKSTHDQCDIITQHQELNPKQDEDSTQDIKQDEDSIEYDQQDDFEMELNQDEIIDYIFQLIQFDEYDEIQDLYQLNPELSYTMRNNINITPIMSSTIHNHPTILQFFIKKDTNSNDTINLIDNHGMSALLYISKHNMNNTNDNNNNDNECLNILLENSANCLHCNNDQRNLLHLLSLQHNYKTLRYLLTYHNEIIRQQFRSMINNVDKDNVTILLYACRIEHVNMIPELIEYGANYHHIDNNGYNCLIRAILAKNIELIKYFIIELKCDVNYSNQQCYGYTPLFYAVNINSDEVIELLLQNGAKINIIEEQYNDTPLSYSVRIGNINAMNILLKYNANVDIQVKDNQSMVFHLLQHGYYNEMIYLYGIQHNIIKPVDDISIINTPNNELIQSINNNQVYQYIKDLTIGNGYTPLTQSIKTNNKDAYTYLINIVGCDINQIDENGYGPIHYTAIHSKKDILLYLLNLKVNIHLQDKDGYTVLEHAIHNHDIVLVKCIVDFDMGTTNTTLLYNLMHDMNLIKSCIESISKGDQSNDLNEALLINRPYYRITRKRIEQELIRDQNQVDNDGKSSSQHNQIDQTNNLLPIILQKYLQIITIMMQSPLVAKLFNSNSGK